MQFPEVTGSSYPANTAAVALPCAISARRAAAVAVEPSRFGPEGA